MLRSDVENGEIELLAFLNELVKKRLAPYARQISGSFHAVDLHERIIAIYQNGMAGIENDIDCAQDHDNKLEGACARMGDDICCSINDALSALFYERARDTYFLFDFMCLRGDVASKVMSIAKRAIKK